MLKNKPKQLGGMIGLLLMMSLTACHEGSSTQQQTQDASASSQAQSKQQDLPLIQAKTQPIILPKVEVCESDECTAYQLATVKTNVDWIDDFFLKRLKKDLPLAFNPPASEPIASQVAHITQSSSTYTVRYLGQNANMASFVIESETYNQGAAHGMHHQEYVIFDLKTKKRIMVDDLLQTQVQQKLLNALYEANQNWLTQHQVSKDKLEITDNFYFGVHGIVFVYPLYELASYADGMTELTLPYSQAKGLIHPEYLPK